MCCCGEGGGEQGGGGQGGRGVSQIGAGIILSAFCSLACSVLCLKLFLLFQFQFMVRNLRKVSVCT